MNSSGVPSAPESAPIDARILAEAADWLASMRDNPLDAARQAEFERWRRQGGDRQRVWRRAERLLARMNSLPVKLSQIALGRQGNAGEHAD